eukprot:643102-Amphidinium_carterae.1
MKTACNNLYLKDIPRIRMTIVIKDKKFHVYSERLGKVTWLLGDDASRPRQCDGQPLDHTTRTIMTLRALES